MMKSFKMLKIIVFICCLTLINSQEEGGEAHPAPEPYSFSYSAFNEDGTGNSREEIGDANGRVTGFYTLLGEDGQERRVNYVADENGFRAQITTNEIGTESKNPADVELLSSAPTAAELAAQWSQQNQQTSSRTETSSRTRTGFKKTSISSQSLEERGEVVPKFSSGAGGISRTETIRTTEQGQGGVGLIGVLAPVGGGGVSRTETIRTTSQQQGGIGVQRIAPARAQVSRTESLRTTSRQQQLGAIAPIQTGGVSRTETIRTTQQGQRLGGVQLVGVAPAGGVSRFETTRTVQGGQIGGFVPIQNGGVSRTETIRTTSQQQGGRLAGVRLVGVAPAGGVSRIETTRTIQQGGRAGLVNVAPVQTGGVRRVETIRRVNTQSEGDLDGLTFVPIGNVETVESFGNENIGLVNAPVSSSGGSRTQTIRTETRRIGGQQSGAVFGARTSLRGGGQLNGIGISASVGGGESSVDLDENSAENSAENAESSDLRTAQIAQDY